MLDVTHVCVTLSQLTQWQSDITGQYIGNKHKLDVASQSICAFQTAGSLPPLPAWQGRPVYCLSQVLFVVHPMRREYSHGNSIPRLLDSGMNAKESARFTGFQCACTTSSSPQVCCLVRSDYCAALMPQQRAFKHQLNFNQCASSVIPTNKYTDISCNNLGTAALKYWKNRTHKHYRVCVYIYI